MLSTDIGTENPQREEEGQRVGQGDGVVNRQDAKETGNTADTLFIVVGL